MTVPDFTGPGMERIVVYEPVQPAIDKRLYWRPFDRYLGIWVDPVTCQCGSERWTVTALNELSDDDDGMRTQTCHYLCFECKHNLARCALPPS